MRRLVPGQAAPAPAAEEFMTRTLDATPELREAALTKERSHLAEELDEAQPTLEAAGAGGDDR